MSKTKNCTKTCLKIDLENKSALSIFVSSNMKKNFLRRIFKTHLFLKSLGPYICVTHEILHHQSISVTLASVEHSDLRDCCIIISGVKCIHLLSFQFQVIVSSFTLVLPGFLTSFESGLQF